MLVLMSFSLGYVDNKKPPPHREHLLLIARVGMKNMSSVAAGIKHPVNTQGDTKTWSREAREEQIMCVHT